jgi:hypothetical protein
VGDGFFGLFFIKADDGGNDAERIRQCGFHRFC